MAKKEKQLAVINGSPIPEEICEEILSRLCAEEVTRFKLVCKEWRDLISCPRFIRFHLDKSLSTNIHRHIALIIPLKEKNSVEFLVWKINKNGTVTIKKSSAEDAAVSQSPYVIGSCDGLICYIDGKFRGSRQRIVITIWNPTTGESQKISTEINFIKGNIVCCGFGRSKITRDYKLVLGTTHFGSDHFKTMHSIRPFIDSSKWKSSSGVGLGRYKNKIEEKGHVFLQRRGTLFRGFLHWPASASCCDVLLAYDLEQEELLEVCALPEKTCDPLTLGVVNGCLTAIRFDFPSWELWVMKEYGVKESWSKEIIVRRSISVPYHRPNLALDLFWVCEDGDYIFGTAGNDHRGYCWHITAENYDHKIFNEQLPGYNKVQLIPFVETLFSPPPMNATQGTSSSNII